MSDPIATLTSSSDTERLERQHGWMPTTPLPEASHTPPAFSHQLVPPPFRDWVASSADSMPVDPWLVWAPALVTWSASVGRRLRIEPEPGWTCIPNLWGMIVADPGSMKSPALELATRPIRFFENQILDEHDRRRRSLEVMEARARNALDKLRKDEGATVQQIEKAADELERRENELKRPRFTAQDSTIEALLSIFEANNRGVLLIRDELFSLLNTLARPDQGGNRERFLELWNGEADIKVDRIKRGFQNIRNVCLSVVGTTQPDNARQLVEAARAGGGDGLIQRFQVAVWPEAREYSKDRPRPLPPPQELFDKMLEASPNLTPKTFHPAAQELWDSYRHELEREISNPTHHPAYAAHLSKYRSLVPSLALLFYATEHPDCTRASARSHVSADNLQLGITTAEHLKQHAWRIYTSVLPDNVQVASRLLQLRAEGQVSDGDSPYDICKRFFPSMSRFDVADGLRLLIRTNHLRIWAHRTGQAGRPTRAIHFRPSDNGSPN